MAALTHILTEDLIKDVKASIQEQRTLHSNDIFGLFIYLGLITLFLRYTA